MRYLYSVIVDEDETSMEYLDTEYRRTAVNHMGEYCYYTFGCAGAEPILVCSDFAQEFMEVAEVFKTKLKRLKTDSGIRIRMKEYLGIYPDSEIVESEDGQVYMYRAVYKDIRFTMKLEKKKLTLGSSFMIVKHNIKGGTHPVSVEDSPSFEDYLDCFENEE